MRKKLQKTVPIAEPKQEKHGNTVQTAEPNSTTQNKPDELLEGPEAGNSEAKAPQPDPVDQRIAALENALTQVIDWAKKTEGYMRQMQVQPPNPSPTFTGSEVLPKAPSLDPELLIRLANMAMKDNQPDLQTLIMEKALANMDVSTNFMRVMTETMAKRLAETGKT